MSTKKRWLERRSKADLSKSTLAYATEKVEVEEVDFSIEINGLMSLKGISGQGTWCHMWGVN